MTKALDVDQLTRKFLDKTLAASEFSHQAHLKAAVWHLSRYDVDESFNRMRTAICGFNLAHGGKNTDSEGYHETVTRCYILLAELVMRTVDADATLDQTAAEVINKIGAKNYLNKFYSTKLLMSREARLNWQEPDLRAISLDHNTKSG